MDAKTELKKNCKDAQNVKSDLLECVVGKVLEAKDVQNIDGAAGTLCEKAAVYARHQPLEHLRVEQLRDGVTARLDLKKTDNESACGNA